MEFRGDERAESVHSDGRMVAWTGGGNDEVSSNIPHLADVHGGAGRDTASIGRDHSDSAPRSITARVDLPADRVVISGQVSERALIEVENVRVGGIDRVRVLGDAHANWVQVTSVCDVRIAGGRGADRLVVDDHDACGVATRVTGGAGATA